MSETDRLITIGIWSSMRFAYFSRQIHPIGYFLRMDSISLCQCMVVLESFSLHFVVVVAALRIATRLLINVCPIASVSATGALWNGSYANISVRAVEYWTSAYRCWLILHKRGGYRKVYVSVNAKIEDGKIGICLNSRLYYVSCADIINYF